MTKDLGLATSMDSGRSARRNSRRGWPSWPLLVIAVVLAMPMAACASRSPGGVQPGSLALLDSKVGSGTCDALEFTGHVQNRGQVSVPHVTVDIAILDAHGAQVGSAIAATDDLRPDAVWAFKASSTARGATNARVIAVTGR